jgi:hypothetical protein
MTETSVDISAVKMSLQTFAMYLKVEMPGLEAKERRTNSWDTRFGPRK